MSHYNYETEKKSLFTERGVEILLAMRDEAKRLIAEAGACTAWKAMEDTTGDSWTMLAALDYLVERGELKRLPASGLRAQDQVYVSGILG